MYLKLCPNCKIQLQLNFLTKCISEDNDKIAINPLWRKGLGGGKISFFEIMSCILKMRDHRRL